jgi:hypothetical protein
MQSWSPLSKAVAVGVTLFLSSMPSPAHGQTVAFKSGEIQSGMTKQCFYEALGSTYTRTISSVSLCPLTISVQSAPTPSYQAPSMGTQGMAFKTGEQTTGMTKQCYYNHLGSTITRTVSAVSLCPLSIPVGN